MASQNVFGSPGHPTKAARWTAHVAVGVAVGAATGAKSKKPAAAVIAALVAAGAHWMFDAPAAKVLAKSGL